MKKLGFIIYFLCGRVAYGQTYHQQLYWLRYYNIWKINKKIEWHNEFDTRHFLRNSQHQQYIQHSRLHYRINQNWNIAAGFTHSLQGSQFDDQPNTGHRLELRPVQEVTFVKNIIKAINLNCRIRLDQRFFMENGEVSSFLLRHRYRFQIGYSFKKSNLSVRMSDEIMFHAGNRNLFNQFDQNRLYFGAEKRFNKHLAIELGYLYLYQISRNSTIVYDRDIVRFTLQHTL
ncbi:MAG: DUF2490 domain-containing protein [Runella sp.]